MSFRTLHKSGDPFILMNAWDRGSAKMFESLGAQAIGTTSGGQSFAMGRRDMGNVSRDEAMAHAQEIVSAVSVPVSADFENGYGDAPEDVAQTVCLAAEVGLAGCSIEDMAYPDVTPYAFDIAVERVRAGVSAARALARDFVFVARADGVMNGVYELDEAIARIQAYEAVGADCVYIPILPSVEAAQRVCASVRIPVNVLALGALSQVSREEFARAGAARISLGSGLARLAYGAATEAVSAMLTRGDFTTTQKAIGGAAIAKLLG